MKFLKLDRAILRNFNNLDKNNVITIKTNIFAIIIELSKKKEFSVLEIISKALNDKSSEKFIKGNIYRKQINYPRIFKFGLLRKPYIKYKLLQASMLRQLLQNFVDSFREDELIIVIYNGSISPDNILASLKGNHRRVYIENGFFPNTLQIDAHGVNGGNSIPRDANFYLNLVDYEVKELPTKVQVRKIKRDYQNILLPNDYIFIPFQIPSDQQITIHSKWIKTMEEFYSLIIELADKFPNKNFVIKEHPSFRQSVIGTRETKQNILFANANNTEELIKNSSLVITLNSTVGIESLLFGKRVITLAEACYNIEGLVRNTNNKADLCNMIIDENWIYNEKLRLNFLRYIWNEYLVHGYYDNLPDDILLRIENIVQK